LGQKANLSAVGGLISSQSQEVQKKCSKHAQNLLIFVNFCKKMQKNAKKCKFLLIFTPIFSLKTNKSYKITLFTTANHPNFQNFSQKPSISTYFPTFLSFFILPFWLFEFVSDFEFRASNFDLM